MPFGDCFFAVSDKRLFHPINCFVDCFGNVPFFIDNFQNFSGDMGGYFAVIIMVFASVCFFAK